MPENPTSQAHSPTPDTRFFGQPLALANIFGVEMWERFSFYGMQGILLIYMYFAVTDGGLGMDRGVAAGIVGAYGGAVYLSAIVGAWISDRLLGSERTLFYSAILIMAGHIALALLPGYAGLVVGLLCVALGSGGLKSNATSLVGSLYAPGDTRREAGFSLFYLGINLGGFLGPILTGLLQVNAGFHWGFGVAAIGMAIGLVQYALGRKNLPASAGAVPNPLPRTQYARWVPIAALAVVLVGVLIATGVIRPDTLSVVVIIVTLIAIVAYFAVILTSRRVTADEHSRVLAFIPLFVASVAFWSLSQQQFTVLTIYADLKLDRDLFGWTMPISWVQSINPVFIILFSGVFAAIWTKLGTRQPSIPVKFALGTIIMGAAFLLFLPFAHGGANSTPLLAMVGILFCFTIAELLLSPVGLSAATKLAPAAFRTQMVALFFLSVALGSAISGWLTGFYDPENETPFFLVVGGLAIVIGAGLWAGAKPVVKAMRGVN